MPSWKVVLVSVVLVVLVLLVVGAAVVPGPEAAPAEPLAGVARIMVSGHVRDGLDASIADASLRVETAGGSVAGRSGPDGSFAFQVPAAAACAITATADGFTATSLALSCLEDTQLDIRLQTVRETVPDSLGTMPVPVKGHVADDAGAPLAGAHVRFEGLAGSATARTAEDGGYALRLPAGTYTAAVELDCYAEGSISIDIQPPGQTVSFRLPRQAAMMPGAPKDLAAHPGPGIGQVTLTWGAPSQVGDPEVVSYAVYRTDPGQTEKHIITTGNSRAFGDVARDAGSTYTYRVAAVSPCGGQGPHSGPVEVMGTGGDGLPLEVVWHPYFEANWTIEEIDRFDADGQPKAPLPFGFVRSRTDPDLLWTNTYETGNGVDDYLYVARDGAIYDFGGWALKRSLDEGRTWEIATDPELGAVDPTALSPSLSGEGAIAGAPNGDILAVFWGGFADNVRGYRYAASEDTWYVEEGSLHSPFHDRPWLSVLKGPFTLADGVVVPYIGVLVSNFVTEDVHWITYDGLHYLQASHEFEEFLPLLPSVGWPADGLSFDEDRDWMQAKSDARVTALGPSLNLQAIARTQNLDPTPEDRVLCPWVLSTPEFDWRCTEFPDRGMENYVAAGSTGAMAAVGIPEYNATPSQVPFAISPDGGLSWIEQPFAVPDEMQGRRLGLNGVQVNVDGRHDQATVVVQFGSDSDQAGKTVVYRFRNVTTQPVLDETIRFPAPSGEARIDFQTLAYLPDGRIVLSVIDHRTGGSVVAVEQ